LKILAGIVSPTEGELKMNGTVASLIEIGSGFHPELTGKENVYYNARILGISKEELEPKFDEIVAFSGIGEKFINSPVKYYSSGMFLRLAFAQSTHLDRDIMLFDEVLAVGDKDFQLKCKDRMYELKELGTSFVMVQHNLSLISSMCDTVLLLDKGEMKFYGEPQKALERYYHISMELDDPNDDNDKVKEETKENHCKYFSILETWGSSSLGEKKINFHWGENIIINLKINPISNWDDINLGLIVMDLSGNILMCNYNFLEKNERIIEGQSFHVKWTLPKEVFGNLMYKINLFVLKNNEIITEIPDIMFFKVENDFDSLEGINISLPLNILTKIEYTFQ